MHRQRSSIQSSQRLSQTSLFAVSNTEYLL